MALSRPWSQELKELTWRHLELGTFGVGRDGIAFKHAIGACGVMSVEDGLAHRWVIRDREDGRTARFETVQSLIEDGWALDWGVGRWSGGSDWRLPTCFAESPASRRS